MVTTLTELLRFQLVPEAAISILGKLMSRDIRLNDATAHKLLLVKLSLNTSRLTQTCTAHQHVQLTNTYSSPTCTAHQHVQLTNTYSSPTCTAHQLVQLTNTYSSPTRTAHQHVQLTNLYSSPTCTSSLSTAAVRNIFPSDKRLRFWLESHTNNASPFPYNACYFSAILP